MSLGDGLYRKQVKRLKEQAARLFHVLVASAHQNST
jgi:hypothetical protein